MKQIGIKLADGSFYPIMEDGKSCAKNLGLTTVSDNQTRIIVDLYRSKTGTMEGAEYVDSIQLDNLNAHPNGTVDIDLNIGLDENGKLHAKMNDPETGNVSGADVTLVSRTLEERLEPTNYEISSPVAEDTEAVADDGDSGVNAGAVAAGVALGAAAGVAGGIFVADMMNKKEENEAVSDDPFAGMDLGTDEPALDEPMMEEPVLGDSAESEPAFDSLSMDEPVMEDNIEAPAKDVTFDSTASDDDMPTFSEFDLGAEGDGADASEDAINPEEEISIPVEGASDAGEMSFEDFEIPEGEPAASIDEPAAEPAVEESASDDPFAGMDFGTDEPADAAEPDASEEISIPVSDTNNIAADDFNFPADDFTAAESSEAPAVEETASDDPFAGMDFGTEEAAADETVAEETVSEETPSDDPLAGLDLGSDDLTFEDDANVPAEEPAIEETASDDPFAGMDFGTEETAPDGSVEDEPLAGLGLGAEEPVIDDASTEVNPDDSLSDINFETSEPSFEETQAEETEESDGNAGAVAAGVIAGAAVAGVATAAYMNSKNDEEAASEDPFAGMDFGTDETAADETVADETVADETVAGEPAFGEETFSEEPASDETFSSDTIADDSLFGDASGDGITADETVADETVAGDELSEFDLPDFDTNEQAAADATNGEGTGLSDDDFINSITGENDYEQATSGDDIFAETPAEESSQTAIEDDDLFANNLVKDNTPSNGINFNGLYDTETENGLSSDNTSEKVDEVIKKKTKAPVIICVICAIICLLATAAVLFLVPSKYNLLGKTKTEKEPVVEEAPAVEEPAPVVEAKEEEVVVVAEPEKVVPEAPKAPEVKPKNITYKIRWGDTLWDIADAYYKNPWKYKYIARYNGIKNPDHIISGTTIVIPAQ